MTTRFHRPWSALAGRSAFDQGFDQGQRQHSKYVMVSHWQAQDALQMRQTQAPYLGMIVSRKVDRRAVVRNRIRRIMREAVRLHTPLRSVVGIRLILLAKHPAAKATRDVLRQDIEAQLDRIATHYGQTSQYTCALAASPPLLDTKNTQERTT